MNTTLTTAVKAALIALLTAADTQQHTIADLLAQLQRAETQIEVPSWANLQAAMDAAPDGSTLLLPAGVTFTGKFVCRKPITLTTAGAELGEGERMQPGATLAKLQTPDSGPAWTAAGGSDGCALSRVEIAASGNPNGVLVAIGSGTEPSLDLLPKNVTLRQVYIHGDPVTGVKRCVGLHGISVTIADSTIAGCRISGQDSQAIAGWNGPGPFVIENNYLEAASEGLLFGGDDPRIADLVPSDITIRGNTFSRPLAWRTETTKKWTVKNLLELKNARHVLVVDNTFTNNWPDGQAGYAVLLTPRNQYGRAPWSVVEDVTVERNTFRDVSSGISILGEDNEKPSQRTNRIIIRQNLILPSKVSMGGNGYCGEIGRAPQFVTIDANTCLNDGTHGWYTYSGGLVTTTAGFVFTNNIGLHQKYAAFDGVVEATGLPLIALARFYPGAVWENNAIGGGAAKLYPAGTLVPSIVDFQAAFSDYVNGILKADGQLAGKGAVR